MDGAILVLNAGSSSVKFSLHVAAPDGTLPARIEGQVEGLGASPRFVARRGDGERVARDLDGDDCDHERAIACIRDWLDGERDATPLAAAGHRVVHGGTRFTRPLRVDDAALEALDALVPLAPLHQPHNLAGIRALRRALPELPQVACFDTAFHHTLPPLARRFAIPRELGDAGIRRYGFHGLSYEYVAAALPQVAPAVAHGRVVVAHLGNGASLCALQGGRSVATTMGFTALDGLVMGTRPGALDPGVLLYLMQEQGYDAERLTDLLYHRSGLLGVSELSSDMRALLASDDPRAREAVDLFVHRIGSELAAMAFALGGLDALVFTAGIGEHAAEIRARVCRDAAWLGVVLDPEANARGGPCLSAPGARASAWVVPTDENQQIARHTRDRLEQGGLPGA